MKKIAYIFKLLLCFVFGHDGIPFVHTGCLDMKTGIHIELSTVYRCTRCGVTVEIQLQKLLSKGEV